MTNTLQIEAQEASLALLFPHCLELLLLRKGSVRWKRLSRNETGIGTLVIALVILCDHLLQT